MTDIALMRFYDYLKFDTFFLNHILRKHYDKAVLVWIEQQVTHLPFYHRRVRVNLIFLYDGNDYDHVQTSK